MKTIVLSIILFLFSIPAFAEHILRDLQFEHITIANGLSQNYITCVAEDADGFIWIGTKNGLNKYDGYKIIQYNHLPDQENSIPSNYIEIIYLDSHKNLWIGTNNGLCRYTPETNSFKPVDFSTSTNPSNNDNILSFFEDEDHLLWIGTIQGTLYAYDLDNNKLKKQITIPGQEAVKGIARYKDSLIIGTSHKGTFHYNPDQDSFYKTSVDSIMTPQTITTFTTDNAGDLWIGTQNQGFFRYGDNHYKLPEQSVLDLRFSNENLAFIGSEENGLICYNPSTDKYQIIKSNQKGFSLNSEGVTSIYIDPYGAIWLGTINGGVNKYDPNQNNFMHFSLSPENNTYSAMQCVFALENSDENSILVGLNTKGVYSLNLQTDEVDKISINKQYPQLAETTINTILKDSKGLIWLGTYKKSLIIIGNETLSRPVKEVIKKYLPENASVKSLIEDSRNRIWIGTSDNGLLCYNPKSKSVKTYTDVFNTYLSPNIITSILEDDQERIWVGTSNGLFLYMELSDRFQFVFLPDENSPLSPSNTIIPMCQIADTLWLGTRQGLIKYSFKDGKAKTFRQTDGLPSESIKGLLHDKEEKQLWISTDKGLSRLDLTTYQFAKFGLKDGIVGTEFNDISFLKTSNGMFCFGCVDGIYSFHPNHIKANPNPPQVVITNYKLYDNKPKSRLPEQISEIPIPQSRIIEIPYEASIFSIDFIALNYTNPTKNQYAYKLEGYDDNWRYVGDLRMATYTNLNPGNYLFKVIASNNDGVWNEEGSDLQIIILPPWWKTTWAYLVYTLLIAGIVFIAIRIYTTRLKMQNQLINEQFERAQLEKLDQLKMQFFSNITHELRTPLTLIISPLETLINRKENINHLNDYLNTIHNNAVKLLDLVNRLLDFSKIDSGSFIFHPIMTEITSFLKNETDSFIPLAKEKQIELRFIASEKHLVGKIDPNILGSILNNLLSNAIKYTPEKGVVTVKQEVNKVGNDKNELIIIVEDTGKGIPADKQKQIFERFYQLEQDRSSGTGIGLSLVKNLVELHRGAIRINSEPGKGSQFTIRIPFESMEIFSASPLPCETNLPETTDDKEEPVFNQTILIAEDNNDLRKYIASILSDKYIVLEAENGKAGWDLARKESPDIILSDILMPEMDGKRFCSQIKQDIQTCHIPFIMITALISEINQIEGLTAGADDYIVKPFNPEILKSKINNVLKNRALISRRYATLSAMEPEEVATEDKDAIFLLGVIEFIKTNISNPDLKVDDLAKNAGMSRTPFFKKIKSLTGKSPNDFIRDIRLNQAAKLLLSSDMTITEIAYNTGFTSPKYFRECFKKQFGETPSEYMEHRSFNP